MEFKLVYEGLLKANGDTQHKQNIRRQFHQQLKILWQQKPLEQYKYLIEESVSSEKTSILQAVEGFKFAPLVNQTLNLVANISIIFLRPEAPGAIITQSGDIDNRLKTLFDALRMPKNKSEIPRGDLPQEGEEPFFCLLEDDNLITSIGVETDRLLKQCQNNSEVQLIIAVRTKPVVVYFETAGFL